MENTTGANMIHCRELSDNQQLSNKHRDRYTIMTILRKVKDFTYMYKYP